MWWIVLLTSIALICVGIGLLLRDYLTKTPEQRSKKRAPASQLKPAAAAFAGMPASSATRGAEASAGGNTAATFNPYTAPYNETPPATTAVSAPRLPAIEAHWPKLSPEISAAVTAINQSNRHLALSIGPPGEPTWSLHNRGFGDYRRVSIGGDSIAWLRLELSSDMRISALLRAHDANHENINRTSAVDRPLVASRLTGALAECLTPSIDVAHSRQIELARLAAAQAAAVPPPAPPQAQATPIPFAPSNPLPTEDNRTPSPALLSQDWTPPPLEPERTTADDDLPRSWQPVAEAAKKPSRASAWPAAVSGWLKRNKAPAPPPPPAPEAVVAAAAALANTTSKTTTAKTITGWRTPKPAPNPAAAMIDSAVMLVNTAFQESGARLAPARDPIRDEPIGPNDRALSIDFGGTSVGLMLIEPHADRIDISVGVADLANFGAARRQSQPLAGLTIHPLAETIATCAWPAIATASVPAA